jgi:hypothetical protein
MEWMYRSINSWSRQWSASRLARFTPGENVPRTYWKEDGWFPQPVWMTRRRENSRLYWVSNWDRSVVQLVASCYTDCSIWAPGGSLLWNQLKKKDDRTEWIKYRRLSLLSAPQYRIQYASLKVKCLYPLSFNRILVVSCRYKPTFFHRYRSHFSVPRWAPLSLTCRLRLRDIGLAYPQTLKTEATCSSKPSDSFLATSALRYVPEAVTLHANWRLKQCRNSLQARELE